MNFYGAGHRHILQLEYYLAVIKSVITGVSLRSICLGIESLSCWICKFKFWIFQD